MKFGINYTSLHGRLHAWFNSDWDGINSDLRQIGELGMGHVRIFLVWPYLQPSHTWINKKGMTNVRRMVHTADERGLDAYVGVLQGHLSSSDLLLPWPVTWHADNMFIDAGAAAAEREPIKTMTNKLSKEPAFKDLTLGSEVSQLSDRSHPTKINATDRQINAQLDALLPTVAGKGHNALYSVNNDTWFIGGRPFTPVQSATEGDTAVVHSWVLNGIAQGYGTTSEGCSSYVLYLAELVKAFGKDSERPMWLQKVGALGNMLGTDHMPEFCRETVERTMDCRNLRGVTWRCLHDVPINVEDFPFFEHSLSSFDERGQLEPINRTLGELAVQYRSALPAQSKTVAMVTDVDGAGNPVNCSTPGPGGSVCDLWMRLQMVGQCPTIIISQVAASQEALAQHGILELHADEHPYTARHYVAVSDPSFETADQADIRLWNHLFLVLQPDIFNYSTHNCNAQGKT